jgi:hypothetical protein
MLSRHQLDLHDHILLWALPAIATRMNTGPRLIVNNRKIYNDFATEGRAGMKIPEEGEGHASSRIDKFTIIFTASR